MSTAYSTWSCVSLGCELCRCILGNLNCAIFYILNLWGHCVGGTSSEPDVDNSDWFSTTSCCDCICSATCSDWLQFSYKLYIGSNLLSKLWLQVSGCNWQQRDFPLVVNTSASPVRYHPFVAYWGQISSIRGQRKDKQYRPIVTFWGARKIYFSVNEHFIKLWQNGKLSQQRTLIVCWQPFQILSQNWIFGHKIFVWWEACVSSEAFNPRNMMLVPSFSSLHSIHAIQSKILLDWRNWRHILMTSHEKTSLSAFLSGILCAMCTCHLWSPDSKIHDKSWVSARKPAVT